MRTIEDQVRDLAEDQPLLADAAWIPASDESEHIFDMPFYHNSRASRARLNLSEVLPAEITRNVFHGNSYLHPWESMGTAAYMNALDPSEAQNAVNLLDGGGRDQRCSSVYLIGWSPETVCMAYSPKHGLIGDDGYARAAIVPVDWRFMVRICNIRFDDYRTDLSHLMSRALLQLPPMRGPGIVRPVFYLGSIFARMYEGVSHFRDVPIRIIRELTADETAIRQLSDFSIVEETKPTPSTLDGKPLTEDEERIARALEQVDSSIYVGDPKMDYYRRAARAAIAAMPKPTRR